MSEYLVQNALHRHLSGLNRWPILPNCDVITGFEADLLALTKARMVYEYEIKCSLADLRADRKKVAKWASLEGRTVERPHPWNKDRTQHIMVGSDVPGSGYSWPLVCHPDRRPKQFWYVCHGFEPTLDELPAIAGLMVTEVRDDLIASRQIQFRVVREAQTLDSQPAELKLVEHAERNMLYRYWRLRCKEEGEAQ